MTNGKIGKESVLDIFELSATQKGILFHYLEDTISNLYNVQLSFEIMGNLDVPRLKAAIETTQSHNEVLRSVFRWEEVNNPIQIILKTCALDFRVKHLSPDLDSRREDMIRELMEQDLNERFDIAKLPLRFTVVRLSDQSFFFIITYHHILLDGWSNAILLKEIFYYYHKLNSGYSPAVLLKPAYKQARLAIQAGFSSDHVTDFWKKYLEDYQIVPLFPEAAAVPERRNKKMRISCPIENLESFARRYNVTKASVIYAAYGILLQKYCHTADVVFGTTVANRDAGMAGIENVMGNFIDTIPVRLSVQGVLSEIVAGMHAGMLERRDHSHTPYAIIKRILNLKPSENLFDSVLVIENYPVDKNLFDAGDGLTIRMDSFYESADIPLLVTVFMAEELVIEFSFDEIKADAVFLKSFSGHLLHIIEAITTSPHLKAETLSILSSEEEDQLIYGFNDTHATGADEETIITLLEKQVAKTPDDIALIDRHHALSYRALQGKSNALAKKLLWMGAREGDIIGIMMPRQQEMLIGILGVLKIGCAYVPIDPDYPPARIGYMFKDSDLTILMTTELLKDTYAQLSPDVLIYTVVAEDLDEMEPDLNLSFPPASLAYLIYTSGTTGNPKGIMIEHRSIVNYVRGIATSINIGLYHSILCLTTVSFDIFVTETILPLLSGLRVVLADSAAQKDPYALAELIIRHGVDLMQITPSHLSLLLNAQQYDFLAGIKAILIGGEALPYELFAKLSDKYVGRVYNMYGPTETTVWSAIQDITNKSSIDIGKPIRNTSLYILDTHLNLQPIGVAGELFIGGEGLARGYWKNDNLTKEKFIANPFIAGQRMYKTGDLAVRQPDGSIKLSGRLDNQVKVRGFRVELGEIETHLASYPLINEAAAVVREKDAGKFIVAYYISEREIKPGEFKGYLSGKLPDYMIPSYFVRLEHLPLTPNGKLDRKALPEPQIHIETEHTGPSNETEQKLIAIWSDLLGHENISVNMNFFDIGGDSLKLIAASNRIRKVFARNVTINDLFGHPTITRLSEFLTRTDEIKEGKDKDKSGDLSGKKVLSGCSTTDVAIIGLACRFPGATDTDEFWDMLKHGRESITRKESSGTSSLVFAKGFLQEYDYFDSMFFNYTPAEAAAMDPQIRVFHECVYEALENAGYAPSRYECRIGLYAGATINPSYNIRVSDSPGEDWAEKWDEVTYTDKDFLCNRVSYKLNLKGPSLNISTACSTSLVAVDKACGELLTGKCDIAIAGGVSITLYDNKGYFYHKDMILSADGKCRAFDESSSGTVGGNGTGVVVLKRMDKALQDGDFIHAVIRGTATNNDGSDKVGFTAPGINGQSKVIEMALENAGIQAESISCVEAHGTGTTLGDPIEIAALTKAFNSNKRQFCAIGSVKTNIGHLDAAAGIAGLIKMVLALKYKQIPPSLHFRKPNPNIDFANSPFFVNAELSDWPEGGSRRRAGVSSFGIGGTNAHVILEEAPERENSSPSGKYQLLTLSAKTEKALQGNIQQLIDAIKRTPGLSLPDVAYTLNLGRESFAFRKVIICRRPEEAVELLEASKSASFKAMAAGQREIVFMFPGLGSQYKNMLTGLYGTEPYFKAVVDECLGIVKGLHGMDLKEVIFSGKEVSGAPGDIDHIEYAHPSLFIVEYALSRLLISWGIKPDFMIGHSVGEYVAACISEVFSLEDALRLVTIRSKLIQKSRRGKMLAVSISEQDLLPLLVEYEQLSLAAVNSSELCVVSGKEADIAGFQKVVESKGFSSQSIRTSHASHSHMMEEVMESFEQEVRQVEIRHPKIPFISNLTGKMAVYDEISDPGYWSKHLRHTVRFAEGASRMMKGGNSLFIEVGPGNTLGTFVRSNKDFQKTSRVIYTVRHEEKTADDFNYLLQSLGKLWLNGVSPDWQSYYRNETGKRIPLPTYRFDKIQHPTRTDTPQPISDNSQAIPDLPKIKSNVSSDWFHTSSWEIFSSVDSMCSPGGETYILFADAYGISEGLHKRLAKSGEKIIEVVQGRLFRQKSSRFFEINPDREDDYIQFFNGISDTGACRILFAWGLDADREGGLNVKGVKADLDRYFYRLLKVARALAEKKKHGVELIAITNEANYVLTGDRIRPGKESLLAALKVIRKEYKFGACRNIDIVLSGSDQEPLIDDLFLEIRSKHAFHSVAYRCRTRFVESFKPLTLPEGSQRNVPFACGGVYLITGGTGGIGLSIAKKAVKEVKGVRLILLGRRSLPERGRWKDWLSSQENVNSDLYAVVEALLELQSLGGFVHYCKADMEDMEELKKVIALAELEAGPIRGVIHAAGVADYAGIIFKRTKIENEKIFSAKIYGTIALNEILSSNKLDFFVLCSSISTALPIEGQVGYVAANMFLNSFARYNSKYNNVKTISIGWNAWQDAGIAFRAAKGVKPDPISEMNSISPDQGYEILLRAITNGLPESIISKFDLPEILTRQESDHQAIAGVRQQNESVTDLYNGPSAVVNKMSELWEKLLGVAQINSSDDFFEIGGDSLKALTLIGRMQKVFNVEISIDEFFENGTLTALSDYVYSSIAKNRDSYKENEVIPIAELKKSYVLSSGQKRLYFVYTFDRSSLAYNVPVVYRMKGALDKVRLSSTFVKLISRHESLRTSFQSLDGIVSQIISDIVDFEITFIDAGTDDFSPLPESFIKPFDLKRAPLIRVSLISRSAEEHFLLIDMHHIITDGVSEAVLMKDFMAIYNNKDLPVLNLQYKDYAEWQQSDLQQKLLAVQKEFWLNEFSEKVTMPDLPADFPRPEVLSFNGDSVDFELSAASVARLKEIAEEEGATLFMVLLSVLNILLYKLSNQEDIIVGTPVANRRHADFEEIIGMFVNTLALRNFPRGKMSFKEFLSEIKSRTLACFDNQSYPYENLVDELGVERDTSRNALFNVVFVFYNTESVDFSIPGLTLEQYYIPHKTSKFDITLLARESGGRILLDFEYATSLFKRETIDRFIGYFSEVVSAVCADIDTKIGDIGILPQKERDQLLREFNDTRVDYPVDKTVIELFEEQVERTPGRVAAVYGEVALSYQELNERANRLAGYLRDRFRLGKEDLVCLCLERSEQMLIGILGVLKAGAAYVPVDPGYPDERISYVVKDTGTRLVLTNEGQVGRLEWIVAGGQQPGGAVEGAGVAGIDGELFRAHTLAVYSGSNPVRISGPSDLAYVIYTSGTTGRPKGVMLEHRGIVNLALMHGREYGLDLREDKMHHQHCLWYANYVFDAHVWEIYSILIHGHSLYIIDKDIRTDVSLLEEYVRQNAIAFATIPPALLDMDHILDVKTLIVAGEITSSRVMERYVEQHINLINAYGPTEATVCSTFHRYRLGDNNRNIGRPIANMTAYVLDRDRAPMPLGGIGELYIGGVGVARGYLKQPELTADRFIVNPFQTELERVAGYNGRLYRTGDLVRYLADGNLEYIGRSDLQVKIRGYRIELGEIESRLSAHPGVRQAVVMARERDSGDKYLVGYYVSDHELSTVEIRAYLQEGLPEYMIPSFFVHLSALPLTINGKLDRKALPEFKMEISHEESIPANDIEEGLVDIWAEILNIDRQAISTKKTFFELGGDSIKIVHLNSLINKRFKCSISIPDLFRYSSITSLAAHINDAEPLADNGLEQAAKETAEMNYVIGRLFND